MYIGFLLGKSKGEELGRKRPVNVEYDLLALGHRDGRVRSPAAAAAASAGSLAPSVATLVPLLTPKEDPPPRGKSWCVRRSIGPMERLFRSCIILLPSFAAVTAQGNRQPYLSTPLWRAKLTQCVNTVAMFGDAKTKPNIDKALESDPPTHLQSTCRAQISNILDPEIARPTFSHICKAF